MSKFFSSKFSSLTPYTPGEQPRDMKYIKLNTNESPFAPSRRTLKAVRQESCKLQLYSDPECTQARRSIAELYNVSEDMVIVTNGSDEVLNFAFMAFGHSLVFPDITYGFYPVFADLNGIEYEEIPLKSDFSVDVSDYMAVNKTVVLANPNAPTGLSLSLDEIERIVQSNRENVVIIDEAYVDFGAQSAVGLCSEYDNLLVVQTFSKSRSMAGARCGFAIGNAALISDLNTIRYSTNPYNVNRMTLSAAAAAICDNDYYMANCKKIINNRSWTASSLDEMGFSCLDSKANFIFAKSDKIGGEELYLKLKEKGILVRHFKKQRIKDYIRITIGTKKQMKAFIKATREILKEC